MTPDSGIYKFLKSHLQMILNNDVTGYHSTTADDLSLYEWWVTPHRIDGLPFHDFMMESNAAQGTVFGADGLTEKEAEQSQSRFDLSNLRTQLYGDTAIASYTLLISTSTSAGVQVVAHNESRVMVKTSGNWQVVHVHKSPAWPAPHTQPAS
jgi:hypothetical protein